VTNVDAASKAVVAMGIDAFLKQAPEAMSTWKDQSGSKAARNKIKTEVIFELKRKAAESASEQAAVQARVGFAEGGAI